MSPQDKNPPASCGARTGIHTDDLPEGFAFECWEIAFPDDDEDTRGITKEQAERLLKEGVIRVRSEGIVTNAYNERVLAHTYDTAPGRDGEAWAVAMDEED